MPSLKNVFLIGLFGFAFFKKNIELLELFVSDFLCLHYLIFKNENLLLIKDGGSHTHIYLFLPLTPQNKNK